MKDPIKDDIEQAVGGIHREGRGGDIRAASSARKWGELARRAFREELNERYKNTFAHLAKAEGVGGQK